MSIPSIIHHNNFLKVAWWLSSRVHDSRSRGCGLELHHRHCVVSLSKTLYPLLSTGTTEKLLTET